MVNNNDELIQAIEDKKFFNLLLASNNWRIVRDEEDSFWYITKEEVGIETGPNFPFRSRALARSFLNHINNIKDTLRILQYNVEWADMIYDNAIEQQSKALNELINYKNSVAEPEAPIRGLQANTVIVDEQTSVLGPTITVDEVLATMEANGDTLEETTDERYTGIGAESPCGILIPVPQ